MSHIFDILSFNHILALSSVVVTFLISFRMYPVIIYISQKKRLMESIGERNSHSVETPSLGGVGLFVAFSLSLILLGMISGLDQINLIKLLSVLAATIILLFLGIKDDLIVLAPKQKFLGQLFSACIVIFMTDIRIDNFNGLLGISELPYMVSVIFTLFVFILVINAYNLIDGIDGLAGSLAIIASLSFGIFFLINDQTLLLLVSFASSGALLGFLRYNLSDKLKLFMGDSGSLFIGYLLAYQGVSFLHVNASSTAVFNITNAPVLLLAILSFPLLDTLRVFAIRIKEKRSPFTADRNHIHHRLLDIGCTHKQATLAISSASILVIASTLVFGSFNINVQLLFVVSIGVSLYLSPFLISLKPDAATISQNNEVYMESMDLKELEHQVKLRNNLLSKKLTYNGEIIVENPLIIMDDYVVSGDKIKNVPTQGFANKKAKNMKKLTSLKKKRQNAGSN